jgi:hypothetical protein
MQTLFRIPNFVTQYECEYIQDFMDEFDDEMTHFLSVPFTGLILAHKSPNGYLLPPLSFSPELSSATTNELWLELLKGAARAEYWHPEIFQILRDIGQKFLNTVVEKFNAYSFGDTLPFRYFLMGAKEGTTEWHSDGNGRFTAIIAITDPILSKGGETSIRRASTKEVVLGPEKMAAGELLLLDDIEYEHLRDHMECPKRRTVLNLKIVLWDAPMKLPQ